MKITGFLRAERSDWIARAATVAAFAAVRVAYARAGVKFRAEPIDFFAQYLDPPLLRDRLAESLWFLHAQPPLFNFLIGVSLKIAPANPGGPMRVLFLLAGLFSCLALAGILARLGLGRWPSAAAAVALTAAPPVILYENWCFYPHVAQALILGAAWCFLKSKGRPGGAMTGGFWLLASLALLRSLFHPAYLLAAAAVAAALAPRGNRRRVLLSAAAPVGLVLLLVVKNLVLFGFAGTSSWGGNSLHRMMTERIDRDVLERMVESGQLTPLSLQWEFSPPEKYLEILQPAEGDRGVPALDQTGKTRARDNAVNYNHWIYPIASRVYGKGALRMMRRHPAVYLESLGWTARRFLDPVTDDHFLSPNRIWMRAGVRWTEAVERSPAYRLLLLAGWLYAVIAVFRRATPSSERLFLAFAAGTVLWVAALGIALEFGENNRFRYQLLLPAAALVVYAARDAVTLALRRARP